MQEENGLNFSDLQSIFNITESRDTFYDLSEKGIDLPLPKRKPNGYRYWTNEMLPMIAQKYSQLPSTAKAPVISFYLSKGGGSHKTTDAFNMASFLGINGKRVLVIDLDFQLNITKKLGVDNSIFKIKETGEFHRGMYEVMYDNTSIEDVITETTMPNVYLIPGSSNLVKLEAWLVGQVRREDKLKNILEPLRDYFDAIIIDNNPSWSQLSISSLCACDINIASIGLDTNTNEALPQFFATLEISGVAPKSIFLAQGLMESNSLKKQVKEHLKATYGEMLSESSIRKSTIVDEANAMHLPVFLYKPKEKVAEDYLKMCEEMWHRSVFSTTNQPQNIL